MSVAKAPLAWDLRSQSSQALLQAAGRVVVSVRAISGWAKAAVGSGRGAHGATRLGEWGVRGIFARHSTLRGIVARHSTLHGASTF